VYKGLGSVGCCEPVIQSCVCGSICEPTADRIQHASMRETASNKHACLRVRWCARSASVRVCCARGRSAHCGGGGWCSFFGALQSIPSAVSSQHPSPVTSHRPALSTHYHPPPPNTHNHPHSKGRNKICTFQQTTPSSFCLRFATRRSLMPKVKRNPYTKAGKASAKKARKKKRAS
jgi:hypothetical protein